jgi:hypothetical protein
MQPTSSDDPIIQPLTTRRILHTWWPLAASWLLMGAEGPAIFAVMARLANPVINLAAFNGLVYPLALIIESPIIMLLAASTALSKDWPPPKVYRFMWLRGGPTGLHVLLVFAALLFVVETIMGATRKSLNRVVSG